jgi:hypothetical protein
LLAEKGDIGENIFLAYFPYFKEIKVGLGDLYTVCVTFEWLNQS